MFRGACGSSRCDQLMGIGSRWVKTRTTEISRRPDDPPRTQGFLAKRLNSDSYLPSPFGRLFAVNEALVGDAATELLDMRARRRVVPDLPFALRPETLGDAYAIQHRLVAGLVAQGGGRCIGFKVACTNEI